MGDTAKGDLIGVRKIALDANMIADIMAIYIRNEPTYEPYALPLFRIQELNKIVSGQCEDDGDMVVVLGALFVLCMFHATSPAFAPDSIRESASILMSITSECLAALELSKKCSYAHPVETVEYQRYVFASEDVLYDTFRYSLEFSREILRDATRCVRTARDRKVTRTPTEAVQPNILLFMCTLALTHIAAVLGAQNQLDTVPGIKETLLLLLSVRLGLSTDKTDTVKLASSCPTPDEHEKGAKMLVRGYYLVRSFELVSRLSCVVAQLVLDKPEVYELSLLHKKLADNTEHSVVVYAKTQAQPYCEFLRSTNPFQDKIATVMVLETAGKAVAGRLGMKPKQKIPAPRGFDTSILLSCGGSFRTHKYDVESAYRRVEHKRLEDLRKEREKERTEQMQRDSNKHKMGSLAVGGADGKIKMPVSKQKLEEDAALIALTNVGIDVTADEFEGLCILDKFSQHEQDVYARIKPVYRYAYVVTRECRVPSSGFISEFFVPTYDPIAHREFHLSLRADRYDSDRTIPQNEIRDDVECMYYNQTQYVVPRYVNPSCGQFWLCVAVVKYILEISDKANTELFASDSRARLRDEIRTIKNLKKAYENRSVHYEQAVEATVTHEFGEHAHHATVSSIDKNMLSQLLGMQQEKEKEQKGHLVKGGKSNKGRGSTLPRINNNGSAGASGTRSITPSPAAEEREKEKEKGKEKEKSKSVFARSRESKASMKISKILNNASDAVDKDMDAHPKKNAHTPHGQTGTATKESASKTKESVFPTSIIEKHLFEHHRSHAPLELTLKDRLVLAGRLGRAEACLDMVRMKEKEAKLAKKKPKPNASSPTNSHTGSRHSPTHSVDDGQGLLHGHGHGHGRGSPKHSNANSAMNSAYNSPAASRRGSTVPFVGEASPSRVRGRGSPTHGRGSPTHGRGSPTHGRGSPTHSRTRGGSPSNTGTIRAQLNESKLLVASEAVQMFDKPSDPKKAAEAAHHVEMILRQRHLSVVWSSCAAVLDEPDPTAAFAKKTGALTAMAPEMAVKEYARQIKQWKESVTLAQQLAQRALKDQQEAEQGKLKTFKFTQLKQVRDARKHWILESMAIKTHIKEEKLDAVKQANIARREEKTRREKANAMEHDRINTLKEFDRHQKANEEMEANIRRQYELIRLKAMTDKSEYNEILRRIEEEARMKYLEERRREIEHQEEVEREAKDAELKAKQQHVKELTQSQNERLRFGTFRHYMENGVRKLGFYDHTKKVLPPYTEYEDENGECYYYDKVTGQSTYKRPEGAEIISAKEEERREYDRQYGYGSFDAMHAHMTMMNSVNNYGGYTDENGKWVPVCGYYDDQGVFFQLAEDDAAEGAVDGAKGAKRPKAVGTLDFMV